MNREIRRSDVIIFTENLLPIHVLDGKNPNVFCIQLLRCVDPLLFINNIPYSLIRWIAVITLSVNSTCYDITGKNYSATHCLLLFAIKAGDLLDSVPNLISMYHEAYWLCYCSLIIFRKFFYKRRSQKARDHTAPIYAININSLHCEARY